MDDAGIDRKVVELVGLLDEAEIPHAIGGAIALNYYSTPRATVDIDVNLFVGEAEAGRILAWCGSHGMRPEIPSPLSAVEDSGQIRLRWGDTYVDLFFAYDEFHDSCRERSRVVDFGDTRMRILSAEDLIVFKLIFDRDKDRSDIEEIFAVQGADLDRGYIEDWLERILDPDDERLAWMRSRTRET